MLGAAGEERLCAYVRARTGIRILDHQMEIVRRVVADACERFGLADAETYLTALENGPGNSPEHEHLVAGVTVGESYFFRDQTQMDFLRRVWLPELIERRRDSGDRHLRIWSAGCSDGQELYSLAILLYELLPDMDDWNLHLLGTDINTAALGRAIRGRYSAWSFRATPDDTRDRYFRRDGPHHWQISPHLRRRVKFAYLNLSEDNFPSILSETNALDLVLCRNVFIYFDPVVVGAVMAKLRASLVPGGCLLLGASDLLESAAQDGFDLHALGGAFHLTRQAEPSRPPADARGAAPLPEPVTTDRATLATPSKPEIERPAAVMPPGPAPGFEYIIQLLGREAWREALIQIEHRQRAGDDSAVIWQFRAKALANLGRAREAMQACEHSIERDPADKHSHFIRALVFMELNRLPAAEEALRRTLYLDRAFVEAHYQLGMLQIRRGRRAAGLKSLRNALDIAERAAPERRLHDAAGMNHARMAAILRNELRMYEDGHDRKGGHRP